MQAAKINQYNQNDYQYSLYKEYLQQIRKNALNYSNNQELSIKYYNINLEKSQNINKEDYQEDIISSGTNNSNNPNEIVDTSGTGILHRWKYSTWDIYEFFPVYEIQPFQYENAADASGGTTGQFGALFLDFKPQAGDVFTFYGQVDGITDKYELFQVTDVNYNRSSKNILPFYTISFRTAPISIDTLKQFNINKVQFFNTSLNVFQCSDCFNDYLYLKKFNQEHKGNIFQSYFNKRYSLILLEDDLCDTDKKILFLPYILNNMILRINKLNLGIQLPKVKDISTNISINEYYQNNGIDPDNNNYKFYAKSKKEIYELIKQYGLIKEEDKIIELLKIQDLIDPNTGEIIWPPEPDNSQELEPIAFIDRDFFSKRYYLILGGNKFFNIYLEMFRMINKAVSNAKCICETGYQQETKEALLCQLDNKYKYIKPEIKYYNFYQAFNKNINNYIIDNYQTLSDNLNLDLVNQIQRRQIIGDLNLPISISFQGGVQWS